MIAEKAQELGRLIGQGEEYKALQRARDALAEDRDLQGKLERLERLAAQLEQRLSEGKEPEAADTEQYDRLVSEVQAHSGYQRLVAAQSNFDKVMLRVQERIMDGMRTGAQSRIITLG